MGLALGFVVGGQLFSFHTDLISDSGLTSESTLQCGSEPGGLLLSFVWAMICGISILCYPPSINKKKTVCSAENEKQDSQKSYLLKSLSDEFISLLKNPTYVLISVAVAVDAILVSGMASFMPK